MSDVKRIISTGFWSDDKVMNEFTPEDKYFMLYLLTNPHTTQLGIYHLPLKYAALELGYSVESVKAFVDRFEHKYEVIKYCAETNEIAIKNYLRHSIVKGGKPVLDCLMKEESSVMEKSLVMYICQNLTCRDNLNNTVAEFVNDIYNKYKNKSFNDNDNDNDNDNERIVDESWTNRATLKNSGEKSKQFVPPSIEEVQNYCNERNNGIDAETFIDFYSSKGWMVGKNKMKDWKAAIRTWEKRDNNSKGVTKKSDKRENKTNDSAYGYRTDWTEEDYEHPFG